MNTNVIDDLAKGSVEAFNLGVQVERERIIQILCSDGAFDVIYSYGDGGADEVGAGLINLIKGIA